MKRLLLLALTSLCLHGAEPSAESRLAAILGEPTKGYTRAETLLYADTTVNSQAIQLTIEDAIRRLGHETSPNIQLSLLSFLARSTAVYPTGVETVCKGKSSYAFLASSAKDDQIRWTALGLLVSSSVACGRYDAAVEATIVPFLDGPRAEDAMKLMAQTQRCFDVGIPRVILEKSSKTPILKRQSLRIFSKWQLKTADIIDLAAESLGSDEASIRIAALEYISGMKTSTNAIDAKLAVLLESPNKDDGEMTAIVSTIMTTDSEGKHVARVAEFLAKTAQASLVRRAANISVKHDPYKAPVFRSAVESNSNLTDADRKKLPWSSSE